MAGDQTHSIVDTQPVHTLGQYQAWRMYGAADNALDLAWVSVAHADRPAEHRLLPHGEPSIAILRRSDKERAIRELRLIICGPYYKGKLYTPAPGEELIAWRVKPELAAMLFGVAPADYSNSAGIEAPQALKQKCAKTLALGESAGTDEILLSLKTELSLFARDKKANRGPEIIAAQWLRDTDGQMRLRDIAARLNVSERTVRRRFVDHTGCSPKTYARHLQITAAALAAEIEAAPDWAEIAAGAGFHDQPHMINAFQSELGMTPKAFHKERRALL